MIIVAHYIETLRFCRIHLTFSNTSIITHHYLIPSYKPDLKFGPIKTGTQVLTTDPLYKHEFKKAEIDIPILLSKIQPHILLCSNCPKPSVYDYCRKNNIKMVYLRHGIANKFVIDTNPTPPPPIFLKLDAYISHASECYQYTKMGIPLNKIHPIEGSTAIDYMKSLNFPQLRKQFLSQINSQTGEFESHPTTPLPPNTRCILLLQNHQSVTKYDAARKQRPEAVKEYLQILEALSNYAQQQPASNPPIHIFT